MKKKHDLITIGELSKLTGVNAKSLRYYEKIGVLLPVFIDPENDYRYYAYSQIQLVSSIQFYVEMNIPLSQLHNFINDKNKTINFREQISYGIEVAKQKLHMIQNQIQRAERLRKEIDRSDKILFSNMPVYFDMPQKTCWVIPIQGKQTEQKYYSLLHRLLTEIKNSGIKVGCETGILYVNTNNSKEYFVFADVDVTDTQIPDDSRFFSIPTQSYQCKKVPFMDIGLNLSSIHEELEEANVKIIILSELFISDFNYRKPDFELRWSLDD